MTDTDVALPVLHIRPARGWVNDPNGLAVVGGRYHVFFQFNPAAPVHENIQWGHVSSADLLRWREEPIALVPRPGGPDAGGCWSGSLIVDDGTPTILYTAVAGGTAEAGVVRAVGDDAGMRWRPDDRMIPGSDQPGGVEVRDPYVFHHDGRRYAVQGAGTWQGQARVEVYGCDDLSSWEPLGPLISADDPVAAAQGRADIWECPNLFQLDGRWVLIYSLWQASGGGEPRADGGAGPAAAAVGAHLEGVVWLVGSLAHDRGRLRFVPERGGRLDGGESLYAPQVLADGDRRLMWGWARETGRPPAQIERAGWCGVLTFPWELSIADGALRAHPAAELTRLRAASVEPDEAGFLDASQFEVAGTVSRIRLSLIDGAAQTVWERIADAPFDVRLFVDGSLVEAFAGGTPCTVRAYPGASSRWRIEADAEIRIWRLRIP